MVKYINTQIEIGLPKPLRFLHTTDNHLTLADERDNERKRDLAAARHKAFEGDTNRVQTSLDEMIDYCNKNCDMMLHTGDLIDFVYQPRRFERRANMSALSVENMPPCTNTKPNSQPSTRSTSSLYMSMKIPNISMTSAPVNMM